MSTFADQKNVIRKWQEKRVHLKIKMLDELVQCRCIQILVE